MQVKNVNKINEIQLTNGTTFAVGDVHGDGIIFEIQAGSDFDNEIKDWEFEDWDGNPVSFTKVKARLDVVDGDEGWSVFLTEDGTEVMEG